MIPQRISDVTSAIAFLEELLDLGPRLLAYLAPNKAKDFLLAAERVIEREDVFTRAFAPNLKQALSIYWSLASRDISGEQFAEANDSRLQHTLDLLTCHFRTMGQNVSNRHLP